MYDLRPPALDELGLVEALREQTRRIETEEGESSLQVSVTADDGAGLPAAVRAGVGLTSLRERVSELAGRLTAEGDGGATVITALAWRQPQRDP